MIITNGISLRDVTVDPGPVPIFSSYLIVGGGGGGSGYVASGAPGGGAGGMLTGDNVPLYVGQTYVITVGAGGPTNINTGGVNFNNTGSNSTITGGDIQPPVPTPNDTVYQTPPWLVGYMVLTGCCSFLIDYGVWVDNIFYFPTNTWIERTYTTQILSSQEYTLRVSAHNQIEVYFDNQIKTAYNDFTTYQDTTVFIDAGSIDIKCRALSSTQPSCFAAALYDTFGNIVWSTRSVTSNPLAAFGGGGGMYTAPSGAFGNGYNGGSGGGEIGYAGGYTSAPGLGIAGQGHNGGAGAGQMTMYTFGGGGGGGAGYGGQAGGGPTNIEYQPAFWGGDGGGGLSSNITGTTVWYAGGGGGSGAGGNYPSGASGDGGQGGGGRGAGTSPTGWNYSTDGEPNTGGGGGGDHAEAGNGGSGIVVLRALYPAQYTTGNPTVTQVGDYYVYKFTQSGTIRF